MATDIGEVCELSAYFIQRCPGLAMDADNNSVKLVYRNKQDANDYQTSTGDKSRDKLRLKSFPVENVDAVVDFLRENAELTKDGSINITDRVPETLMRACKEKLEAIFSSSLNQVQCCVEAHEYMFQHVPTKKLARQGLISNEEIDETITGKEQFLKMTVPHISSDWEFTPDALEASKNYMLEKQGRRAVKKEVVPLLPGELPGLAPMEDSNDYYPCLVVDVGDIVTYTKITRIGKKYEVLDRNSSGMDCLLGLSSLIAGVADYDELMNLAEKGDFTGIHGTMNTTGESTQSKEKQEKNMYTKMQKWDRKGKPHILFSFGDSLGKSLADFSAEDRALAVLHHVIMDLVNKIVALVLPGSGIRHVMATGSMLERPVAANIFMHYWHDLYLTPALFAGQVMKVQGQVLAPGAYLGAIGAMINSVNPFQPSEQ